MPVAGIITPGDARIPAVLGAIVVALTGLRPVFHWRENWARSIVARGTIRAELRLYSLGIDAYADPSTKDANLLRRINSIELSETTDWKILPTPTGGGQPAVPGNPSDTASPS